MRRYRGTHFRTSSRRRKSLIAIASVVGGLLPAVLFAAAAPTANATAPSQVSFNLLGCRNDGTITLPNGSGKFICDDAAYTQGNLGKGWNELDLVPLRMTASSATNAPDSQTYTIAVAADRLDAGRPGWDFISAPELNTTLSDATCSAPTVGAVSISGTTTQTIYRLVTITQPKNTDCVYDYYARLALGSHLFPGSSLQAELLNENLNSSGIGQKTNSIPVNQIAPQELDKDMEATQNSTHVWDVTKSATPTSLSFTNTCDPAASLSAGVQITVSWTKRAASPSGDITIVTHVYATNPAARTITTSVSDQLYSGTTAIGSPVLSGAIPIPAHTSNVLVIDDSTTVPSGTTGLNDIATGSYTDTITGVPIPGTTTATASATVQPGSELNGSAVIGDVESITGSGLSFSVDSTSGASGTFGGGYVAGTHTTGPLSWTSSSQSNTGSVTFNKTVYATAATVASGGLSDTATLTGSDGFTTQGSLTVNLDTNASTSLTVTKDATLSFAADKTYTFHLFNGANVDQNTSTTVTIPGGSIGPVTSDPITGLSPTGTYNVKEDAQAPFGAQTSSSVTFSLVAGQIASCSADIQLTNSADPVIAQVRKITAPTSSGNWTFTLTGPGGLNEQLTNVVANAGYVQFPGDLDVDGGTYTITETQQTDYDLTHIDTDVGGSSTGVSSDTTAKTCTLTLNLTAMSGQTFECSFTNTQRGTIIVKKVTNPTGASGSFTFTGDAAGSIGDGQTITVNHLAPGTYTSTEADPTPSFDLTGISCDDANSTGSVATRTATFHLDPGETVTCTFTNRQRGTIIVKKVTDPAGSAGSFTFTGTAAGSIGDGQTITVNNLAPGTYTSTEANPTPAFDLTGISCNDGASATASTVNLGTRTATFKLDPGETVTCTFTNRARGHAKVVKTVSGNVPSGSQSYTFQLRQGASASAAGTILETGTANAADGGVINFATYLVPGTTYQLCEQMSVGWMTSLGPPLYSVYNPSGDNSVVCTDFTVTAGQTKTFNIDNTPPPGGFALTIGYWKNWSSCSGGKQKPTLDNTLLAAANAGHPITVGILVLDPRSSGLGAATACKDAVNILNKSTIDGKSKKASDPLFNMAAQLLAADLNVQGGAGSCAASTSAMTQGQQLLVKYNWDGLTYSPKLTSADANLANQLATTLDRYNNNKLC
jgi:hypothetical protein